MVEQMDYEQNASEITIRSHNSVEHNFDRFPSSVRLWAALFVPTTLRHVLKVLLAIVRLIIPRDGYLRPEGAALSFQRRRGLHLGNAKRSARLKHELFSPPARLITTAARRRARE